MSKDSAWTYDKSWINIEIKPEKAEQYHSEAFTKINNEAPLKEFLNSMKELTENLEMSGMSIRSNFVANIREDIIDTR